VHPQSEREGFCSRVTVALRQLLAPLEHLSSDLHGRSSNGHNGAFIV
jgi:hypothetical protein